jgi:hypothetical protein
MSELKVNKISPRSGTDVTLGDSGDTFSVPSGATLDASNATVTYPAGSITDAAISSTAAIQQSKISGSPGFRNIIINGDMSIAQRGTSQASAGSSGGLYQTVDRYKFLNNNLGVFTISQDTDVPSGQGFANSLKMDCTTADASPASGDYLLIQVNTEGQNLQYIKKGTASAESLTLSFWVKAVKTGTFIVDLVDVDNNRTISQSYTINTTNTWEKKTLTFAGDTTGAFGNDNGKSLECNFWLGAGTDFTSGTLQTSWGTQVAANRVVGQVNIADDTANEWYITGVQLEAGTTASDFEFLPVDVNLNRCFRYFENESTTSNGAITVSQAYSTSASVGYKQYKVRKRTEPCITFTGTAIALTSGASSGGGTLAFADISVDNCRANISGATSLVAGNASAVLANTAMVISYDAEL